jgi:putative tryptophan/tyrosine transport system substrate-binding protein
MQRRAFVAGMAAVMAVRSAAEAQQVGKVWRVGFLQWGVEGGEFDAFRQGLRDLGYVQGKNVVIEKRNAEGRGDRLPGLVADLIRARVDVIVTFTTPAARAAQQAMTAIPIVTVSADPVGTGLVRSLAQPGGNTTGLSLVGPEADGKALELLKETVPGLRRVAFGWDPANAATVRRFQAVESAAQSLGLQVESVRVRESGELEKALEAAIANHARAVFFPTAITTAYGRRIVEFAARKRWPAMYTDRSVVEAGGLMSYSANVSEQLRRAAIYVDRILNGAKPADLPIEQATKFEFVINLKTAKALGLTIPPSLLLRADQVIE